MVQGRRPGFKHSKETKDRISKGLRGQQKSETHRMHISDAMLDPDGNCARRFVEMRGDYPGFEEFFDDNRPELLFAMRDIRSEKELGAIRKYIETDNLKNSIRFLLPTSSIYATEDLMIEMLDLYRFFKKAVG